MKNNGKLILSALVLGVFALAFLLLVLTRNKPVETPPTAQSVPSPALSTPATPITPAAPVTAVTQVAPAAPKPPVLSNALPPAIEAAEIVAAISNVATQRNTFTLEYGHSKTNKHRRRDTE